MNGQMPLPAWTAHDKPGGWVASLTDRAGELRAIVYQSDDRRALRRRGAAPAAPSFTARLYRRGSQGWEVLRDGDAGSAIAARHLVEQWLRRLHGGAS